MNELIEHAWAWSAVAAFWSVALLILFRQPPAFGRWLSACEIATPWWVTLVLLGVSALAMKVLAFHIDKLLAATTEAPPEQVTLSTILGWLFGFAWQGFTGSVEMRAHLQAVLVFAAILLVSTVLVYRQRYSIFAMDIVARRDAEAVPRRVVVMGLSLDPRLEQDAAAAKEAVDAFKIKASALDLEAAARANLDRFPWQQNLRVLKHHLLRPLPSAGWLRRTWRRLGRSPKSRPGRFVVVVPSRESAPHAEAFKAVAAACAANSGCPDVQLKIWERAADYNDLDALRRELLAVVRELQRDPGVAAGLDEISIDTTPGMKLVSIAGAAVTFASPLEFTYVETAQPNRVVAFDVRAAFRIPFQR
jgi:hypothetical protein